MFGFMKRRRHPVGEADLSAYLDDRASPEERRRLEEHLRTCPACASKLEGLRSVVAELRHLPPATAPRSFALTAEQVGAARGDRRTKGAILSPAAGRLYVAVRGGAVAAALVLCVAVGADLFLHSTGGGGGPNGSTVTGQGAAQPPSAFGEESGVTGGTAESKTGALPENDSNLSPSPTVIPRAAPLVPGVAPSVSPTATVPAFEKAAAKPASASEDEGRRWLWVLEGTAGGLALVFGGSALWLRRLARRE
ncbi:MAG: zf-HC2 domain-containing protein [Dehalococcoidia bacterium]|jgi:hypothetical protein